MGEDQCYHREVKHVYDEHVEICVRRLKFELECRDGQSPHNNYNIVTTSSLDSSNPLIHYVSCVGRLLCSRQLIFQCIPFCSYEYHPSFMERSGSKLLVCLARYRILCKWYQYHQTISNFLHFFSSFRNHLAVAIGKF